MNLKYVSAGIGLLTIAILATGYIYVTNDKTTFAGTVFEPPVHAQEIELTDDTGNPFKLSSLYGRIVLLYFGYTHCEDECPLTMAKLSEVFKFLGEESANIQVLLITTDPVRDTPDTLRAYVTKFNPTFLGLTGGEEPLNQVYVDYGVAVLDKGETHSNRLYVVDRNGNLRLTWPYEMSASDIVSDLTILLKE